VAWPRRIFEAQQQAIDANPGREFYNLNIDAGAMWARRLTDQMVAREGRFDPVEVLADRMR
jgi:hypothetical protein